MSTSFETESQKSPETLEQEINAKRASISNIVDSLESRFTPGQLFDQALSYTKGNGGEFFQNLGTTLKNNPVPTALTGLGLAWLAINQNKPFNPGAARTGRGLGDKLSEVVGQVSGAVSNLGDRLHDATDTAMNKGQNLKDKAVELTHRTTDSLDSSAGQVGETAHTASQQLTDQATQLKGQFDNLLKEQPLVLAAIGIALGAVLGAALPSTRKEDELMGDARDNLVAKAKSTGGAVYATARDTVKDPKERSVESDEEPSPESPSAAQSATDLSAGPGIRP
jgi:ElaB/YqjD/DUF883 family membrane-anchored ribosome-binding protein